MKVKMHRGLGHMVAWMIVCVAAFCVVVLLSRYVIRSRWMSIIGAALIVVPIRKTISVFHEMHNTQAFTPKPLKSGVMMSDAVVRKLLEENSIIELDVLEEGRAIKIGTSSDYQRDSDMFFDKRYYIDNQEYQDINQVMKALQWTKENEIEVSLIDGITPDKWAI